MNSPYLELARSLATEAARRLMELRLTPLLKQRKADHSLVTNADREADQIIREGINKVFPDHDVLTEESPWTGRGKSEFTWVVDPLDGTKAYASGIAGFSVMIGLLRAGRPFAGVVVDPWEGHIYEAQSGEGTYYTLGNSRTRVQVSKRNAWAEMPVVTSTGFPDSLRAALSKELTGPWVPPVNSVGIKVGLMVRQVADIYVNHHAVHLWDTCAPEIILEEAGGTLSYFDGRSLTYPLGGSHRHAGGTLATNGVRHREALALVQGVMRPSE